MTARPHGGYQRSFYEIPYDIGVRIRRERGWDDWLRSQSWFSEAPSWLDPLVLEGVNPKVYQPTATSEYLTFSEVLCPSPGYSLFNPLQPKLTTDLVYWRCSLLSSIMLTERGQQTFLYHNLYSDSLRKGKIFIAKLPVSSTPVIVKVLLTFKCSWLATNIIVKSKSFKKKKLLLQQNGVFSTSLSSGSQVNVPELFSGLKE